jgi:hypothetical protein
MKLIKTNVTDSAVWMRFADDEDQAKAKEWLDVQVPADALKASFENPLGWFAKLDRRYGVTKAPAPQPLGDLRRHPLGLIQEAALRHVQDVLKAEIKVLEGQR